MKRSKKASSERGHLAIRTVRYIHTIISRSLKDAVKLGFVNDNIARNASPPRQPKTKAARPLWTAEETRTFLDSTRAEQHRLWVAWAFIATSGDRRGANLGLRWQDIDFERGTAALTWTVTCVNHHLVVKPYGKTGDNHEIILDRGTLAILRSWRSFQIQERLAHGESHVCESPEPDCEMTGYHVRDLVFARTDGDYLHPERFSREFKRAQVRYNRAHPDEPLPEISLHALRHGWATVALEAGVAMKVVQDRLNHASERHHRRHLHPRESASPIRRSRARGRTTAPSDRAVASRTSAPTVQRMPIANGPRHLSCDPLEVDRIAQFIHQVIHPQLCVRVLVEGCDEFCVLKLQGAVWLVPRRADTEPPSRLGMQVRVELVEPARRRGVRGG